MTRLKAEEEGWWPLMPPPKLLDSEIARADGGGVQQDDEGEALDDWRLWLARLVVSRMGLWPLGQWL